MDDKNNSLPKLVRPRLEVEARLRGDLAEGQAWINNGDGFTAEEGYWVDLSATASDHDAKQYLVAFGRWFNRVDKYLRVCFAGDSVAEEFGGGLWGNMGYHAYSPSEKIEDTREVWGERCNNLREIIDTLELHLESGPVPLHPSSHGRTAVFVVHGHDEAVKVKTARLIESLGLKVVILHENPAKGRTIVEKFEQHSKEAGFAVVIASPDDVGALKGEQPRPRARQNVWLELGYFVGMLGRDRVALLRVADVEVPSDLLGVEYIPLDPEGHWKYRLVDELQSAGFAVSKDRVK